MIHFKTQNPPETPKCLDETNGPNNLIPTMLNECIFQVTGQKIEALNFSKCLNSCGWNGEVGWGGVIDLLLSPSNKFFSAEVTISEIIFFPIMTIRGGGYSYISGAVAPKLTLQHKNHLINWVSLPKNACTISKENGIETITQIHQLFFAPPFELLYLDIQESQRICIIQLNTKCWE